MSININFLPWREARREKRTRVFYGALGGMLLIGMTVGLTVAQFYQHQLDTQQKRNSFIKTHIDFLNDDIATVQNYQADAQRLGEQIRMFQTLHHQRIYTAELFNDLSSSVIDGVVYKYVRRNGSRVSIAAVAENEWQISEQRRQIAKIPSLGAPEYSEIITDEDEITHIFEFDITQPSVMAAVENSSQ